MRQEKTDKSSVFLPKVLTKNTHCWPIFEITKMRLKLNKKAAVKTRTGTSESVEFIPRGPWVSLENSTAFNPVAMIYFTWTQA